MAEETETPQEDVSELRKAAEAGRSAKAEAEAARKELAFVKAGVDTSSKPAQAMLNTYAGELTAEAIQAEAREWSLLDTPKAEPETPDYSAEAAAQEMRDGLDGSPAPDSKPEIGGVDAALEQFKTNREAGMSQTDATNNAIGAIIAAAARGDKQAIFDPAKWEAEAEQAGHGAKFAR